MSKNLPKSTRLDGPSKKVLSEIAREIGSTGAGISATSYRAQHRKQIDLLEKLEGLGLLRKDQDRYWVTLHGLTLLKDEKSKALLGDCEKVFAVLQLHYESNPKTKIMVSDLARLAKLSFGQAAECLGYMCESHFIGGYSNSFDNPAEASVEPAETVLRYDSFAEIVAESILLKQKKNDWKRSRKFLPSPLRHGEDRDLLRTDGLVSFCRLNEAWNAIRVDFDTNKKAFGKKIGFVVDPFKREVLFRDIAHAYYLAEAGFSKPAVILAGSVIEELLRLFLEEKKVRPTEKTFDCYIKACADNGLLKSAIHRLTDSVRHFRNLVHLQNESSQKHTISKATAKGAVASIFTIVNDFQQD